MNINSEYIQKKEFHTAFKGYNMEEVDKFLDILSVEFDRLMKKSKELQDGLDSYKFETAVEKPAEEEKPDMSKLVSEVLVSAHKVADEIKKKAEFEAKSIVENKKNIEEKEIKNLLEKKEGIEEKLKFASSYYSEFLSKIKVALKEINLKVDEIEKSYHTNQSSIEKINSPIITQDTELNNITVSEDTVEKTKEEKSPSDDLKEASQAGINIKEEEDVKTDIIEDNEEDKKIRQIIENDDFNEEPEEKESFFKREKKVFNNTEEEKILRERKKLDIANPDIIDDFFSNNDERKY